MLHLLAFSPARADLGALLEACLNDKDAVVLLDQGLDWLADRQALGRLIEGRHISLYVLADTIETTIATIDHAGLIELTEQHQAISSWYP